MKNISYLDPDNSIAAKVLAMTLAGLAAAALWFWARIPDSSIMMVFGAPFMVMAAGLEINWNQRFRVIMGIAFFTCLMQFGMAILDQQQIILLIWWMAFSFFLCWRWHRRVAATAVIALACFAIPAQQGFQPGIDRFICMILASGCALFSLSFVEISGAGLRIGKALRSYRHLLAQQVAIIAANPNSPVNPTLQIQTLRCARIANNLLDGQRFLLPAHRAAAEHATIPLEHLHIISRAIILLQCAPPQDLLQRKEYLEKLSQAILSVDTPPLMEASASPVIEEAATIIANQLSALQKQTGA